MKFIEFNDGVFISENDISRFELSSNHDQTKGKLFVKLISKELYIQHENSENRPYSVAKDALENFLDKLAD